MWDPTPLRKTVSIPATPTTPPVEINNKHHRKTTHAIHKANTIGIPSEADLAEAKPQTPTSKTRLNIFGFRNTLRAKHKSDSPVLESPKDVDKNDVQRRWSETNQTTVNSFDFFLIVLFKLCMLYR